MRESADETQAGDRPQEVNPLTRETPDGTELELNLF